MFDPMVGTGSTVIAAIRSNRDGYGIDLVPEYVRTARKRIAEQNQPRLLDQDRHVSQAMVLQGDATRLDEVRELSGMKFDYVVTSPPYWSMLTNPGSEGQASRRAKNLPLVYSTDKRDLGNIQDYELFLSSLESVYKALTSRLQDGAFLTIIVKNVKRNHTQYTLAWDLARRLACHGGDYEYVGTTLWCQDDIGIKPFAVGILWVSNTLHQYCLHFRKRKAD